MRRSPLGRISPPLCSCVFANGIQSADVSLSLDIEPGIPKRLRGRIVNCELLCILPQYTDGLQSVEDSLAEVLDQHHNGTLCDFSPVPQAGQLAIIARDTLVFWYSQGLELD